MRDRILKITSAFCLVACLPIGIVEAQESPASSGVEKQIALFEAEFAAAYESQVNRVFRAKKGELDLKYGEALERLLQSEMKAGRLEEAVSIREEVRRVEAGEEVPATDAPQDPPPLTHLRSTYRTQLAGLAVARDQLAEPVIAAHDAGLAEYQAGLTTAGKLDEALAVKAARERIRGMAGKPTTTSSAPAGAVMPVVPEKPGSAQTFRDWLDTVVFYQHSGDSTYYLEHGMLRLDNINRRTFHYPILSIDEESRAITWRYPNGVEQSLIIDAKQKNAQAHPFNYRIQDRPDSPLIPGSDFVEWLRTKQFRHGTGDGLIWTLDGENVLTYIPGNEAAPLRRFPVIVIYSHDRTLVWDLRSSPDEPEKTNEINVEEDLRRFRWRNPEGIYQMQPLEVEPRDPAIFGDPSVVR